MEIYGIGGTILKWFENYLTNRKQQYIQISNIKNTDLKDFFFDICKWPTICFKFIRPHYVRWWLFYAEENIKTLFDSVNTALQKIGQWFISNKLSLNVTKAKNSLFHKPSKKIIFP